MTASCLYRGTVMHRRIKPFAHKLRYRVFWTLLDLDELELLARKLRLFSLERFNLFGFYKADHGDGSKAAGDCEQILTQMYQHDISHNMEWFAYPFGGGYQAPAPLTLDYI